MSDDYILNMGNVKAIEGDDNLRARKCLAEIQKACARYDCVIRPEIHIEGNQLRACINVLPIVHQGAPDGEQTQ